MEVKRFTSMVLVGLVAIAPGSCSDPVAPTEDRVEQLLFLSNRDAVNGVGSSIYRINPDGTGVERLTTETGVWYHLSLSRDGSLIAFTPAGSCNIFVMNADGTNPRQLTNRNGGTEERCNASPRWSRDGVRVAFLSNREQRVMGTTIGLYDVYVMNADGSNPHNVSRAVGDAMGFNVEVISWSADGRVVFQTSGSGSAFFQRFVYTVKPDGTDLRQLFSRPTDNSPFWSPDGSKVVFTSARDGRRRLYIMNADGSGERPLTASGPWDDDLPAWLPGFSLREVEYDPWSPDGKRIAFERWGDDQVDKQVLHVINADGSGMIRVSDNASEFNGWSPNGRRIAFTKRFRQSPAPPGIPEVFVVNADGTGLTNVTNHVASDTHAIWVTRP